MLIRTMTGGVNGKWGFHFGCPLSILFSLSLFGRFPRVRYESSMGVEAWYGVILRVRARRESGNEHEDWHGKHCLGLPALGDGEEALF